MYYDNKTWARTKGADGRLPLFTAAARSLKWSYTRQIFTVNMPVVDEIDILTGLPLFMLAAVGPVSDIESIYNLLRENPPAISVLSSMDHNSAHGTTKRRGRAEFVPDKDAKILKVGY